jgi:hypothetical protein
MAALEEPELTPESLSNGDAHDIAEGHAPFVQLTTLKDGAEYKQKLTEILERAGRHPIVSFELNKLEEALKVPLIACGIYKSFETKYKSNPTIWKKMSEDDQTVGEECIGLFEDEEFEADRVKQVIDQIHANPALIPAEWSHPPGFSVTDKGDCNGETESPLSLDELKEGEIVKLSDGRCYNIQDLINFYNSWAPRRSPFTRQPFTPQEVEFMRRLTLRRRPLGFNGSWAGGKLKKNTKTKKNKKSKKSKPKKTKRR